jgi:hypothetical protein
MCDLLCFVWLLVGGEGELMLDCPCHVYVGIVAVAAVAAVVVAAAVVVVVGLTCRLAHN